MQRTLLLKFYKFYSARKIRHRDRHEIQKPLFSNCKQQENIWFEKNSSPENISSQKWSFRSTTIVCQADNVHESKGVHFDSTIFSGEKSNSAEKHRESFPQFLRKLSSVPQDQKINEVSLGTGNRFSLQKTSEKGKMFWKSSVRLIVLKNSTLSF